MQFVMENSNSFYAHIVLLSVTHTLGQVQAKMYAQILHQCIVSSLQGRANEQNHTNWMFKSRIHPIVEFVQ
jgi:hypothetical protein